MTETNDLLILAQAGTEEPGNAEIGLAEEVTAEEEHVPLLVTAEALLLYALIVLFVIVWKPVRNTILGALDKRAERIKHDLEEAERLREEAQSALASFQRRQRESLQEAERIVAHAREEAERIRVQANAALEQDLKRREEAALERIRHAEQMAAAEIRSTAVDVAVAAARRLIAGQIDRGKANLLINTSIKGLEDRLH